MKQIGSIRAAVERGNMPGIALQEAERVPDPRSRPRRSAARDQPARQPHRRRRHDPRAQSAPIFHYQVNVVRVGTGLDNLEITISQDLFDAFGSGTPFTDFQGAVRGVRFDSFGGVRRLPTLRPGESLNIVYELNAFVGNSLAEIGFSALVGDPFQVSGPGGFQILLGPPTVPEPFPESLPGPSTLALLATGLVAIGAVAGRRRRDTR
jgi:hypothetical protein